MTDPYEDLTPEDREHGVRDPMDAARDRGDVDMPSNVTQREPKTLDANDLGVTSSYSQRRLPVADAATEGWGK